MEHAQLFIILGAVFGFFMAWGIGANDVANAMGLSVGSRAITLRQALLVAAIFEAAGALLAGGQVTDTIRSSIIDISQLNGGTEIYVYGMLAALLAAGCWLLIASHYGWPVSTTHTIVGAIIGFALPTLGVDAIRWYEVLNIVGSWIITPIIAASIAYLLFVSLQIFIFNQKDRLKSAERITPIYIFLTAFVIVLVTLTKGLSHLGIHLSFFQSMMYGFFISVFITLIFTVALIRVYQSEKSQHVSEFIRIEKIFSILMLFTACTMAFSHGANDVANAIGPLAGIVAVVQGQSLDASVPLPFWILALGAVGIVIGLGTYGWRVIATIGMKITELTPSRGFAAGLATAMTVMLASGLGLPVSTTQTLVGAVLGVGIARGVGALNLNVVRNIFMSWVVTLPVGALLSLIFFYLIDGVIRFSGIISFLN